MTATRSSATVQPAPHGNAAVWLWRKCAVVTRTFGDECEMDKLLGYEKLMLVCGFVLFVFALGVITVMIVQWRNFKTDARCLHADLRMTTLVKSLYSFDADLRFGEMPIAGVDPVDGAMES